MVLSKESSMIYITGIYYTYSNASLWVNFLITKCAIQLTLISWYLFSKELSRVMYGKPFASSLFLSFLPFVLCLIACYIWLQYIQSLVYSFMKYCVIKRLIKREANFHLISSRQQSRANQLCLAKLPLHQRRKYSQKPQNPYEYHTS